MHQENEKLQPRHIQPDMFPDYMTEQTLHCGEPPCDEKRDSSNNENPKTKHKEMAVKAERHQARNKEGKKKEGSKEMQWAHFLELAKQSKANSGDRAQVWIDSRLKRQLELLRITSLGLPVTHILNGIIESFLEFHSDHVKKQLIEE